MTLQYVSLTCDLFDGQGSFLAAGAAVFTPSAQLTDTADHEIITQAAVTGVFRSYALPVVRLLATDNGAPLPAGWVWEVTFTGMPAPPPAFSFFLPFASGPAQYLSGQAPVAPVAANAAYLPLSGGQMAGVLNPAVVPLADAATIAVNAGAGNDFEVTLGGNRTLGAPSGGTDGQKVCVCVTQPATGGPWSLAYAAAFEFGAPGPPALATAAGANDLLGFRYNAAKGKWQFLGSPAGGFG